MDIDDVVSVDPEVMSGAVVFKGTRVPVSTLFEYLKSGDSLAEFLLDFPTVDRLQAEAVIRLAAADIERLAGKKAA
ncbi:DUF433 domain-containing protein [Pseudaminobacter sp. 19-2017]|uniref:DUF433 domain-containing protein n=1 Tax=Pseudaminobacter soli (ex Zhang et al. 2022) TaxID=2831468 RepID=A0A942DWP2_9HYPH|nr:DUF433 domain-containing protein [Pseudaminobacter soli]MBS3648418.1 DUF433 domain-containing protein [Pseudaminobacter soli]